jgi:hypothetical protein
VKQVIVSNLSLALFTVHSEAENSTLGRTETEQQYALYKRKGECYILCEQRYAVISRCGR